MVSLTPWNAPEVSSNDIALLSVKFSRNAALPKSTMATLPIGG